MAAPHLTDGIVTLREHRESDVDRIVEQSRDPVSIRWTVVPTPYSPDDAKRFVRHMMPGGWATDQEWGFAIEHDGRFCGTTSLRNRGEGRAEVAYGAHPDARGTGVMERALRLLLEWGFAEHDLKMVFWLANVGNWSSRNLAWRVGFDIADGAVRRWLPHRGELTDAWLGTLLPEDVRQPRHPWLRVPVIDAGTVRLRPLKDDDLTRVVEACSDPGSRTWMRRLPDPFLPEHARHWIERKRLGAATGDAVSWAIADPDTDLMLGSVDVFGIDRLDRQAEVGYWVHPDARGHGVAVAGCRAAVRHALIAEEDGGLGLQRVDAIAAVANAASCGVLRSAGLREVGLEHAAMLVLGRPTDALRFEATR